jgi:hypothetical protein
MAQDHSLDLERHRDLLGRSREPWIRRGIVVAMCMLPALALANVFGQEAGVQRTDTAAASLAVEAPTTVRGGLLFQSRFEIVAKRTIAHPTLVLSRAWLEGLSVNTLEPAPVDESWSKDGLELSYQAMSAGETRFVYLQYQVNPTTVERRSQRAELRDGAATLASVERTFTVLP